MWAAIVNTILGIWTMACPKLLAYQNGASDNNHIVGPLIVTFSMIAIWEVNRSVRLFNIITGLWLAASPFILGFDSITVIANNLITGLVIAALSMVKGRRSRKYGGGWRSLVHAQKHEL